MYESIGRWIAAVAITLGLSIVMLVVLQQPLKHIDLGIRNSMLQHMIIGSVVTSVISVLIGPLAQGILKTTKGKDGGK